MESKSNQPPLIVIVGETASGKSALALQLAERFNGEIICADSWTVRREVTIGTAKPSFEDRKRVPHHLLDIVDPCADFSAAVFKHLADQAVIDITSRGRLPFLVGGTGLYVDSVIFNYSFLPEATKGQREKLNNLSISQLLDLIKSRGLSLEAIDIRNKRRLIRLIESNGLRPTRQSLRPNTLILGMATERDQLRIRIENRVERMLSAGLEQEVRRLAQKYGWDCEALKGIGYREWQGYLAGIKSVDQVRDEIVNATIQLAKRQRTWFKRNDSILDIRSFEETVDLVTTFLNKYRTGLD